MIDPTPIRHASMLLRNIKAVIFRAVSWELPIKAETTVPAAEESTIQRQEKKVSNSSKQSQPGTILDHSFLTDQPIQLRTEDRLNRWAFASRIAETLATRKDPSSLVIGLYGPWGDGKTSTLHLMEESLAEHKDVIVVRFNPWHFQSEELLLRGFFATLAEALGKSLPNMREALGDLLRRYGSILSFAISWGGVQITPGEAMKGLGETLSIVELGELRRRVDQFLKDSGRRVVILIDDIDRLDRVETQAVFKLVKLSAGFNHTSYVLSFDDDMVAAAIGERYGAGVQRQLKLSGNDN